jgi:hypothetical protein
MNYPRGVWAFALALMLCTSLPYGVGWWTTPPTMTYTGAPTAPSGVAVDYHSHMAKMWQGARGGLFGYRLLFTSEAHAALPLVQGFYVALGLVPLPFALTYHLARAVLTGGMVLALWSVAAAYLPAQTVARHGITMRAVFMLFSTLVTGYGWLLFVFAPAQAAQIAPIEFWLQDAYTLFGALLMPHFAAAVIAQCVAFVGLERYLREGGRARLIRGGVALLCLSVLQPYIAPLSAALLGMLMLWRLWQAGRDGGDGRGVWARVVAVGVAVAAHAALIVYQYLAIQSDPIWRAFTAQNITASPPPLYYLLGYAPLLWLAVLGLRGAWHPSADNAISVHGVRMAALWVLLVIVLVYAPLATQRRYLLGVQVPLALLAAVGWCSLMQNISRPPRRALLTVGYVALAALPLALNVYSGVVSLHSADTSAYLSADESAAAAWVRANTPHDAVLLTTFDLDGRGSGGRVVAATSRRVYVGHWIETAEIDRKIADVRAFYQPQMGREARRAFLRANGIGYVWYDASAAALGAWSPADGDFVLVFDSASVQVWQVVDGG